MSYNHHHNTNHNDWDTSLFPTAPSGFPSSSSLPPPVAPTWTVTDSTLTYSNHSNTNNGNNSNNSNSSNNNNSSSSSSNTTTTTITTTTTTGGRTTRPSDARRKLLNEELSVPLVSNFFPIERYYDAAEKVYESFQTILQHNIRQHQHESVALDDAYVYGKRYCLFCLDGIPTHNYYSAQKYRAQRNQHQKQVQQVIQQLELVVQYMDQQEIEKQKRYQQLMQRQQEERERQQQEKLAQWQARILQQQQQQQQSSLSSSQQQNSVQQPPQQSLQEVQASALEKLKLLSDSSQPPAWTNGATPRVRVDPEATPPTSSRTTTTTTTTTTTGRSRYRFLDDSEDGEDGGGTATVHYTGLTPVPPPLNNGSSWSPSPSASPSASASAPPSYDAVVGGRRSSARRFLGPAASEINQTYQSQEASSSSVPSSSSSSLKRKPPTQQRRQPMHVLQEQYRQDYVRYQQMGKIQVSGIRTYQGRVDASTNGCTVISALIAAQHLQSASGSSSSSSSGGGGGGTSGGGITNDQICRIIDAQCGPILRNIRSKLGLGGHALIIPSDVHDHLVDAKVLSQQDFEGVAGGNILDDDHLSSFVDLLAFGDGDSKKNGGAYRTAAATLFFREHVVSIVKIVQRTGSGPPKVMYDLIDSLPGLSSGSSNVMATRTRCVDLEALYVLLRWYASRKLTPANCTYCDRNAWDDALADFDPRVFQGFVWMAKAKQ